MRGLVLRVLVLLPVTFAVWHFTAPATSLVAGHASRPLVKAIAGPVEQLEARGSLLQLSIALDEPYVPGRESRRASATPDIDARIYTCGLPLYLALALAMPATRRWRVLLPMTAALLLLPAVGVSLDASRQLLGNAELQPLLAWREWQREAIALGYQASSLLLPTLAPVALWLASGWKALSQAFR